MNVIGHISGALAKVVRKLMSEWKAIQVIAKTD